jgi:orotate phosphoribosyltransferase
MFATTLTSDILKRHLHDALSFGALDIRDVDNGEEPFLYSSGFYGPGYVDIKGLISKSSFTRSAVYYSAIKFDAEYPDARINLVAANVTGGMIPGWLFAECLRRFYCKPVSYVYVRDTRKRGGHKELITGLQHVDCPSRTIVIEELVNYAETTINSVLALREAGFEVNHAACILFYDNPIAKANLIKYKIHMTYLFTLPQLLDMAVKGNFYSQSLVDAYLKFLDDPAAWQKQRGLTPVKNGGTQ